MKKQWMILVVIVFLVVLAMYQSTSKNLEALPKIGYQAPPFELKALDGKTYSLEGLKGKPVVINFWASWCGPCRIEAPEFVRLYEKYRDQIEIYAVNLTSSDSVEGAKEFAETFGFLFPVLLDEKGKVSDIYQVRSIPTSFFVKGDGMIVDKVIGVVDPKTMEDKFRQLIP